MSYRVFPATGPVSPAATLQSAYDNGPDITQDATGGILIQLADSGGNTEYVLRLASTDETSGTDQNVLEVDKSPAVGEGGNVVHVIAGANASGDGLHVEHSGSGAAIFADQTGTGPSLQIQHSSANVLLVEATTGQVSITPPLNQDVNMITLGTGSIDINQSNASAKVTLDNSTAVGGGYLTITSAQETEGARNFAESIRIASTGAQAENASIMVGDGDPDTNVTSGNIGSIFLDGTNGAVYVKTADEGVANWSQLSTGAGGNNLQQAYDTAPNPNIATDASGGIEISNPDGGGNTEYVLRLSSVDDTSGVNQNVLEVDKSPGAGEGGNAIDVNLNSFATGEGINVLHAGSGAAIFANMTGSGEAITIQESSANRFNINSVGLVEITPGNNQDCDIRMTGSGDLDVEQSATNARVLFTNTSAVTGGYVQITADAEVENSVDFVEALRLLHSGGENVSILVTDSNPVARVTSGNVGSLALSGGAAQLYVKAGNEGGSSWHRVESKHLYAWYAFEASLPTLNSPTQTTRNNHRVLAYGDQTNEIAYFEGTFPESYSEKSFTAGAGVGVEVEIHWVAASATTGDVKWDVAFEADAAGGHDIDSDSFAAAQSTTSTTAATAGVVTVTNIAFTGGQIDSIVSGDAFRISVLRDAADAADDMTGDAQILRVVVRES